VGSNLGALFCYRNTAGQGSPMNLERDFNIPELEELQQELERLNGITEKVWKGAEVHA